MTTNDVFKKIYKDIKENLIKCKNSDEPFFLLNYVIPSINYNPEDKTLEDHYFTSGIEMELDKLLKNFNGEVEYWSYKDTYSFSNDIDLVRKHTINLVENDMEM